MKNAQAARIPFDSLAELGPGATQAPHGFAPAQVDEIMQGVYERGDRIMERCLLVHAAVALIFGAFYSTWLITLVVTGAAVAMFKISRALLPRAAITRSIAGVSLQTFVALHIYQLHGLAEMHFFFFTAFALMIVYQDWKCMWLGTILIIGQHLVFAILHNTGVNLYFFEDPYIGFRKLFFHFGIAIVHVGICGCWAHLKRSQTIEDAWRRALLREQKELLEIELAHSQSQAGELSRMNTMLGNEIAGRERTDLALRKERTLLQTILDSIGEGVVVADRDGKFLIFNPEAEQLLGRSATDDGPQKWPEKYGFHLSDQVTPFAAEDFPLTRAMRGESVSDVETFVKNADLETGRWLALSGRPLKGDEASVQGGVVILTDITERKRVENELKISLLEKETLLTEIHHRVKNNMQVISSLLRLQSSSIQDPGALAIFRESQDRIRSIALIHEKLYQTQSLSRMDFAEYVQSLTAILIRTYGPRNGSVKLEVQAEPVWMDVNTAIPAGLILNELVSNCLKHAFPDNRPGQIHVELRERPESCVELVVRDDGVGLPEGLVVGNSPSLGLRLVTLLAGQARASLQVRNGTGSEFTLLFGASQHPTEEIPSI